MQNDSNRVSASNTTATFAAPALPETTADKFQTTDAVDSENSPLPPVPVDSSGAQPSARPSGVAGATEHSGNAGVPFAAAAAVAAVDAGWGGVFGPPYSAIFVDVDNKDASVGMSSPPAAFLEKSFLDNLKALLQGAGLASVGAGGLGGGGGGEGPPGVLAMNVAARSKQLFSGAVDAVCQAFPGGEVKDIVFKKRDIAHSANVFRCNCCRFCVLSRPFIPPVSCLLLVAKPKTATSLEILFRIYVFRYVRQDRYYSEIRTVRAGHAHPPPVTYSPFCCVIPVYPLTA